MNGEVAESETERVTGLKSDLGGGEEGERENEKEGHK
jgi:hypothetical protein